MAVPRTPIVDESGSQRPTLRDVARTAPPPEGFVLCEIKGRSAAMDPLRLQIKLNAKQFLLYFSRQVLRLLGEPERVDLFYDPRRHAIALRAGSRRTGFKVQRHGQGGGFFAARGAVRRYELESFGPIEGTEQDGYLVFVLPPRGGDR